MFLYILSTFIILIFYLFFLKKTRHWEKKGVKTLKNISTFNLVWSYFTTDSLSSLAYRAYKLSDDCKLLGVNAASIPVLMIKDPELARTILVKDFSSFQERGLGLNCSKLSINLLFLEGKKWQLLRKSQTPQFTTNKLKQATTVLVNSANKYVEYLTEITKKSNIIELKKNTMAFTTNSMANLTFGLDGAIARTEPGFLALLDNVFKMDIRRKIHSFFFMVAPKLTKSLKIQMLRPELVEFIMEFTKDILKEREKNNIVKNDFMDYVKQLKEQKELSTRDGKDQENFTITDWVFTSQSFFYFVTGVEAPSNTMSYLLYELALNPKVQQKCYEEIQSVMAKTNEKLDYDSINELKYLKMTVKETLRKYPNAPMILRRAVTDYTFPGTNVSIEKGQRVIISVMGMHYDPKYFPNPEEFDPERFSPQRQLEVSNRAYMPFGDGPRQCLGMRLAKLEVLACVSHLLYSFKVEPCENTRKNLTFNPFYELSLVTNEGLWVKLRKR